MATLKKNILFLVEGKTEGDKHFKVKGLWGILKNEQAHMRSRETLHHVHLFNGVQDMLSSLRFRVENHITPPTATKKRQERLDIPCGDYVFILRDADCKDREKLKADIDNLLEGFDQYYSVHFAVPEIEAWMIADLKSFNTVYKYNSPCITEKIKHLSDQPENYDCNEKLSDFLEHNIHLCGSKYRKTIEGPLLLNAVDARIVIEKCPNFKKFVVDLREKIDMPESSMAARRTV
jgi:hypothetical protein